MTADRPKTPLEPRILNAKQTAVTLGVWMESDSPYIVSAVFRDLLLYASTLSPQQQLHVCSNLINVLAKSQHALPVKFVSMKLSDCETWVGYYSKSVPDVTDHSLKVMWKKVGPSSRVSNPRGLTHNDDATLPLPLVDNPTPVPPSQSPNSMVMPNVPRGVPSMVPSLYPWLG